MAAIGLGLAGVGSIANSSSSRSAATTAANASNYGADRAAGVIRENYLDSANVLGPWQRSGLQANALLNDFYGITGPAQSSAQPNALAAYNPAADMNYGGQTYDFGGYQLDTPIQDVANWGNGGFSPSWLSPGVGPTMGGYGGGTFGTNGAPVTTPNSGDAFRRFIENSDYGFQFGEGANKVNSGYAGAGVLQSGAAMKGIERLRQDLQSGYRNQWAAGVGNQQSLGFGAASAQAGVSQNVGNSLANIYQQQGDNNANAALARGQSSPWNALSLVGGGLVGYGSR